MDKPNQIRPQKMKFTTAKEWFGVSVNFLRKAVNDGVLSYTKIGNCFMIDSDELQKLLESNTYRNN